MMNTAISEAELLYWSIFETVADGLIIIDLKTGHQPLSSASGNSWITYNGEVYNYKKIAQELPITLKTNSDTLN